MMKMKSKTSNVFVNVGMCIFATVNLIVQITIAIGITCACSKVSTYFISSESLMTQIKKALMENHLASGLKSFKKYKLLIY